VYAESKLLLHTCTKLHTYLYYIKWLEVVSHGTSIISSPAQEKSAKDPTPHILFSPVTQKSRKDNKIKKKKRAG
jgi:hypothetical protein